MKTHHVRLFIYTVLAHAALASYAIVWDTSLPPDPSLWPYGDTNEWAGNIPSPETTPGYCYVYRPSAVQANGRVYVVGGRLGTPPSGYVAAHSHVSIFNPFETNPSNMWQAAKWDGSGPRGINMGRGAAMPVKGDGVSPAGVALGAFDVDFDGTEELFLFSGENHPGNVVMMYDPDDKTWTNRTGVAGIVNVVSCAGGQVGGKYYLHGAPNSIFVYDFLNDSWETRSVPDFPMKTTQGGSDSDGKKIYMPWGAYDNLSRTSSNSFGLAMYIYDPLVPNAVVAGAVPPFGANQAAVVAYRDRVYLFGGRIAGGADSSTNLIQVYFVESNMWYVSQDKMPLNINAPAVWFANRRVYIANGYLFNNPPLPNMLSNVFWSCDIRELDPPFPPGLDVFPTEISLGMTVQTGIFFAGNTGAGVIEYTNTSSAAWLSVQPTAATIVGLNFVTNLVTVNRALISGPVTGYVYVTSSAGTNTIAVYADKPRAKAVAVPNTIKTFPNVPAVSFRIYNTGTEVLYFTNSPSVSWITGLAPLTGVVSTGGAYATVTFAIDASAPQNSTGVIHVAGNDTEAQCTVIVNPHQFYVSPGGSDANNGQSPATAWRTLAHAVATAPDGNEYQTVRINVAAGTYANECSIPGTNLWYLRIHDRKYTDIIGAGPEQSFITKGTNLWPVVVGEGQRIPSRCPIDIRNCENLRFSGFTIDGTEPPAVVRTNSNGDLAWDSFCTAVGVENPNGVRLDHLYVNCTYTGPVYHADLNQYLNEWDGWLFFAVTLHGLVGPKNVQFDHLLVRGAQRSISFDGFTVASNPANTNTVIIDHCTLIEAVNTGTNSGNGVVRGVTCHFPGDYLPQFRVTSCIIGDMPAAVYPYAQSATGLHVDKQYSSSGMDSILPYSNQFWSVGVPVPGTEYWNDLIQLIIADYELPNFTDEQPVFITHAGLPYSTDVDTPNGIRDVGWNAVPEPAGLVMLVAACVWRVYRRG